MLRKKYYLGNIWFPMKHWSMQSNEGFFAQEHYSQATGQRKRRCDWLKAVGPAVTDVEQKGWSPGAGKQPVHHLFTHSNPSDSCVMFGVIRFVLPDNNLTMSLVSFTSHTPQAGETDPRGVDDLREDRLNCVIFYCVLSCPRTPSILVSSLPLGPFAKWMDETCLLIWSRFILIHH